MRKKSLDLRHAEWLDPTRKLVAGFARALTIDGVTDAEDHFHTLDPVQSEGLVDTTGGVGSPGNLASLTILNVPVSATLMDPLGQRSGIHGAAGSRLAGESRRRDPVH